MRKRKESQHTSTQNSKIHKDDERSRKKKKKNYKTENNEKNSDSKFLNDNN